MLDAQHCQLEGVEPDGDHLQAGFVTLTIQTAPPHRLWDRQDCCSHFRYQAPSGPAAGQGPGCHPPGTVLLPRQAQEHSRSASALSHLICARQRPVHAACPLEHLGQVVVPQAGAHLLRPMLQAAVVHILRKGLKCFLVPAWMHCSGQKVAGALSRAVHIPAGGGRSACAYMQSIWGDRLPGSTNALPRFQVPPRACQSRHKQVLHVLLHNRICTTSP